jgi:hypothetical protein
VVPLVHRLPCPFTSALPFHSAWLCGAWTNLEAEKPQPPEAIPAKPASPEEQTIRDDERKSTQRTAAHKAQETQEVAQSMPIVDLEGRMSVWSWVKRCHGGNLGRWVRWKGGQQSPLAKLCNRTLIKVWSPARRWMPELFHTELSDEVLAGSPAGLGWGKEA